MFTSLLRLSELLPSYDVPFVFFVTDLERYIHVIQKDMFIAEVAEGERIRNGFVTGCLKENRDVVKEELKLNDILFDVLISPIVINKKAVGCCGLCFKKTTDTLIPDDLYYLKLKMEDANSQLESALVKLKNIKDRIKEYNGAFDVDFIN